MLSSSPSSPRSGLNTSRPLPKLDSPKLLMVTDPDTCRICRGEAAPGEPLFYPCKCSGSIKYVHQNCLMEWLSHSQKKHCELCKTPFRFTKLYSPNMPKSLPVHVFVGHMTKHVFRNLLVWTRALVVISVWLFCLPYIMRSVWGLYFWFSDQGLGLPHYRYTGGGVQSSKRWMAGIESFTCAASPLYASRVTNIPELLNHHLFRTRGQSGWFADSSTRDPVTKGMAELFIVTLRAIFGNDVTVVSNSIFSMPWPSSPTLLSEVPWLQDLTSFPALNAFVIIILEGQIITVLVIVSFILIILVRDYVVQQQPEINMRAAFGGPGRPAIEIEGEHPLEENLQDVEEVLDEDDERQESTTSFEPAGRPRSASETLQARPQYFGSDTAHYAETLHQNPSFRAGGPAQIPHSTAPEQTVRPPDGRGPKASVHEFLKLWREANSDAETFLQLVKDRNLEDNMETWIAVTRSIMEGNSHTVSNGEGSSQAWSLPSYSIIQKDEDSMRSLGSSGSSMRLAPPGLVDNSSDKEEIPDAALKGKGKEPRSGQNGDSDNVASSWDAEMGSPDATPIRCDSRSGRRPVQPSPLAYNNWSFAALPGNDMPTYEKSTATSLQTARTESAPPLLSDTSEFVQAHGRNSNDLVYDTDIQNDLQAATRVQDAAQAAPRDAARPPGLLGRVANFMFADIEAPAPDWVDMGEHNHDEAVVAMGDAPIAVDRDHGPDAIDVDDLEDFDGVMELLGMRGPIFGLFQNAIFCAVLVALTIFFSVFIPYNIGRFAVWLVANPTSILRAMVEVSRFVQDVVMLAAACASLLVTGSLHSVAYVAGFSNTVVRDIALKTWDVTRNSAHSIVAGFWSDLWSITSEVQNFSAISHTALLDVKGNISSTLCVVYSAMTSIFQPDTLTYVATASQLMTGVGTTSISILKAVPHVLLEPSSWVITLDSATSKPPLDAALSYWDTEDRIIAITVGYLTLSLAAALYLRRGAPISVGHVGQQWEASVIDVLHQASGVMKVIVVISIEMLVFPLYCGLLLDAALLPLFENTTVMSRVIFTLKFPLTSAFVHWFVGTGYMFHFALFVSMCRKVMRKGVLYFIRDPDDPDFHPVRDVLERSLITQLRKILFSAFVYGALVIICLGGVVWGLWFAMPSLLPIHYSSNEPVLEFPIDLLFYNFAMPLVIKFFKPSDSLHAVYTWWFRKCARGLRLTWFLFGERMVDEEGILALSATSENKATPWWRKFVLEVRGGQVVPMAWDDFLEGGRKMPSDPLDPSHFALLSILKRHLIKTGQLIPSGRLVHTPASDQIKIQRGMPVFREAVDVADPIEGTKSSLPDTAFNGNGYQLVYVPPHFGTRVFLFILFTWLFAAITGVGLTIIPLLFGRHMFKTVIPTYIGTNDIYAFSLGIYVLGSLTYTIFHSRSLAVQASQWFQATFRSWYLHQSPLMSTWALLIAAKLLYAYSALLIVFPLLTSAIMELFILLPIHTLLYRPESRDGALIFPTDAKHTVRVIQTWTLGILILKLGARVMTEWYEDTRLAMAIQAVMRNGLLHPDLRILTRAFVIPGVALGCIAILGPVTAIRALVARGYLEAIAHDPVRLALLNRAAYPMALSIAFAVHWLWRTVDVFNKWTVRIRDEAYLIGERLHNFGVASSGPARVRGTGWRAGGNRL